MRITCVTYANCVLCVHIMRKMSFIPYIRARSVCKLSESGQLVRMLLNAYEIIIIVSQKREREMPVQSQKQISGLCNFLNVMDYCMYLVM